jgi:hypothetical protein
MIGPPSLRAHSDCGVIVDEKSIEVIWAEGVCKNVRGCVQVFMQVSGNSEMHKSCSFTCGYNLS